MPWDMEYFKLASIQVYLIPILEDDIRLHRIKAGLLRGEEGWKPLMELSVYKARVLQKGLAEFVDADLTPRISFYRCGTSAVVKVGVGKQDVGNFRGLPSNIL